MKLIGFWLVCMSLPCALWCQEAHTNRILQDIQKARTLTFQNKDSALIWADLALQSAEKVNDKNLVFKALRTKALILEDNKILTQSKEYYQKALDIANTFLSSHEQLAIYTDWAIIHKKLGQYDIARQYHQLTIDKGTQVGNWEMVENGYHGLGTMYSMLSDFNQSIHQYHKSIEAAEKWGNKKGIVLTEQNISNIYMKAQNVDMALKNIEKTYLLAQQLGDSARLGAVLKIYGKINIAKKDFVGALDKHQKAKIIFEKNGDKAKLAESYLALGDIYLQLNNLKQADLYFDSCQLLEQFLPQYSYAEFYQTRGKLYQAQHQYQKAIVAFNESLKTTNKLGFKELAKDNHLHLAQIYTENKRFENANLHIIATNRLSDSLFQEANQKNMTEAQFKFDVEKRDLQIQAQQKQLKQSNIFTWLLISGLIILALILWFTWHQMREKQAANKRTTFIIKELHHRVKNNMQIISSMMRIQARQIQDKSVAAVLLDNKLRLETFAMLHQQLYIDDNVEKLNMKPFIENMIDKLKFLYSKKNNSDLTINLRIEEAYLKVENALSIGLILNELVTNSLKHAKPKTSPLQIDIQIMSDTFYYSDNDATLPLDYDFEKNQGFGIQLITFFAQQIKGKYKFSIKEGMHFELLF
jgi:two-component sensor histidine kinase